MTNTFPILLASLLALGTLQPARAASALQPQDPPGPSERFRQRFGQTDPQPGRVQVQQPSSPQPRQQPSQSRPSPNMPLHSRIVAPERRENWGELARRGKQRAEQRREETPRPALLQRAESPDIGFRTRVQTTPALPSATAASRAPMPRISERERSYQRLDAAPQRSAQWTTPNQRIIAEARARETARRDHDDEDRDDRWRADRDHDTDDASYRRHEDRIAQQREWSHRWERQQAAQRAQAERQREQLDRQRRYAQYRYQQDYWRRWHAGQERWRRHSHGWDNDAPYFGTYPSYRYYFGNSWHFTSHYGANLLQQAIRDGYREGWYAGRADRADDWRFDYRNNFSYLDGSFGYHGYYVSYSTYRHYFREGFERGYRDGYYRNYRYGRYDDDSGWAIILPLVLTTILNFQIH